MPTKLLIESRHQGQVIRLVLDNPPGNVLDTDLINQLRATLRDLIKQESVKLIQFSGAGEHFSFGASVQEHTPARVRKFLTAFHGLFRDLADFSFPTAVLVSGQCLGGGMELALMGNFVFLDRSARLGQPEINLGVFAPPASLILPLKVGQARADEILLTGRTLAPREAQEMGLVTEIFKDRSALEIGVEEWVQKNILPKSASSLKYALRAVRHEFNRVLRKQLDDLKTLYCDELMQSHDAQEGIQAFLEKRSPDWKDR